MMPIRLEKTYRNIPKSVGYQRVAEVAKSGPCFTGINVGDRLLFAPFLNPQKSTGNMCPKALLRVPLEINALWEMTMEWAESGRAENWLYIGAFFGAAADKGWVGALEVTAGLCQDLGREVLEAAPQLDSKAFGEAFIRICWVETRAAIEEG